MVLSHAHSRLCDEGLLFMTLQNTLTQKISAQSAFS